MYWWRDFLSQKTSQSFCLVFTRIMNSSKADSILQLSRTKNLTTKLKSFEKNSGLFVAKYLFYSPSNKNFELNTQEESFWVLAPLITYYAIILHDLFQRLSRIHWLLWDKVKFSLELNYTKIIWNARKHFYNPYCEIEHLHSHFCNDFIYSNYNQIDFIKEMWNHPVWYKLNSFINK